jgi:hypothetical protein
MLDFYKRCKKKKKIQLKKEGNLYPIGIGIVVETSIYCPKLMDMLVEL